MKKVGFVTVALGCLLAAGCTETQKGAGIGTLVGAGAGAIVGHQSGHAAEGALIGAAAGAAGGALIGDARAIKYCPKCGTEYPKTVEYCTKDGTALIFKDSGGSAPQQGHGGTH